MSPKWRANGPGRFVAFGIVPLRSGAWPLGWKTTTKGREDRLRRPDRGDRGHRVAHRDPVRSRQAVRRGDVRGVARIGAARGVPRTTTVPAAEIVIAARRAVTATVAGPRVIAAEGAVRTGRIAAVGGAPAWQADVEAQAQAEDRVRAPRRAGVRSAPGRPSVRRHRVSRPRDGRPPLRIVGDPSKRGPRRPARPRRDERRRRPAGASAAPPPTSRPRSSGSVAGGVRSCWNA